MLNLNFIKVDIELPSPSHINDHFWSKDLKIQYNVKSNVTSTTFKLELQIYNLQS